MIYKIIDEIPDGTVYISHKPYTDGFDLHCYECIITSIVVRDKCVIKKDNDTGFSKYPLDDTFLKTFILGNTEELVLKEKLKLIHSIRTDLIGYVSSVITKMNSELASVNYFDIIKLYPEVEI